MFKKFFCRIGVHNWKFYVKTISLMQPNKLNLSELDVPIRECVKCGKMEHHLMPGSNGGAYSWRPAGKFRHIGTFKIKKL